MENADRPTWVEEGIRQFAIVGATLTGRRMPAIGRVGVEERRLLSPAFRCRLRDPLLWISVQPRAAIALGIVFLITVKPDQGGALVAIGAAIIVRLTSALPARGENSATDPAVL